MEHVENQDATGQAGEQAATTVGPVLRRAREAAGLTRANIATQTKIAERHLAAIEEDRLGDLAARTYAVGFSRAYARALGLDEKVIADIVHRQLEADGGREPVVVHDFEPGDPARVPSARLAWIAGLGALVVVALLVVFWSSYLSPEGKLPDLISPQPAPAPTHVAVPVPVATPTAAPTTGPVVLTATEEGVWLRVTDGTGTRLVETTLKKGETWTVPEGVQAPKLRLGRPDALAITVGGRTLPPLASKPMTMSNVSLVPADLIARTNPQAAATAPGAPARASAGATVPVTSAVAPSPAAIPAGGAADAPAPAVTPLSTTSE
ncbi:cytoskeletal protein RodZ [Novosphingobium sp. PhB165]|uniref:helix-turn-helix domain-containing protein n=1 Tax=Novosphingobium sp. PhB165 TaxID=2485105 RepID=UPI0010446607|nr:helix-turn-helix domain-containing protein [Novosphingobium sp. PhB165]TCM19798.1 cytoskeletal protein RodZ [Novosphingobium sp. PhB165]